MNEHQIRRQQKAEGRLRFLKALGAGQVHVYDRFGAKIEPGAKILFHAPVDMLYEVQSVQPDLSENAQPGQMTVTIGIVLPIPVGCNTPWPNAVVLHAGEVKPAAHDEDAVEPPGPPESADVHIEEEPVRTGPTGLVDPNGRPVDDVMI